MEVAERLSGDGSVPGRYGRAVSVRVSLRKAEGAGLLHGCDCPSLWRDVTDLGVTHLAFGYGGVGDPETDDPEIDFRVRARRQ